MNSEIHVRILKNEGFMHEFRIKKFVYKFEQTN